jgi:phosphatidate cytidylyltransferase
MFFIGLPAIVALVLLLPHYHHLAFNILVVIFSSLGAVELSVMLAQKQLCIPKVEAAILGALPPLSMLLTVCFNFHGLLFPAVIAVAVSWLLISRVFSRGRALDNFINRFVAGCAVLLYPGMLFTWLVRMSRWEDISGTVILVFVCTVFAGDSSAWAAGMLFGRGNRGIIPVSPNKSVAGYIGGGLASIAVCTGAAILLPEIFPPQYGNSLLKIPAVIGALLGLATGIAAALGDLGESAIKRSSGIKDSGSLIPGRGGVLDSVDSISLAAPVFYLVFILLFSHPA